MKDYENDVVQPKKGHSQNAYNYYRFFEEKSMLMLQDKNQTLQECL